MRRFGLVSLLTRTNALALAPTLAMTLVFPARAHAQISALVPMQEFTVPWGREGRPRDAAVSPVDGAIFFVGQEGQVPTGNYVARLDPKTGAFKQYALDPGTNPHSCLVDAKGNVWYTGNRNGTLGRIDPKSGEITRFKLPDSNGIDRAIDIGAHELWSDPAAAPGQVWTGFRFIDIAAPDLAVLRAWVSAPGSEHA